MTTPAADRPQYSDGTPVPLTTVDTSTAEFSRGLNPQTGAKGAEPAEVRPSLVSVAAPTAALAGGSIHTVTGDNMGGSTGATVGGTAATVFSVLSETQCRFTVPARTAGAAAISVANPAGASTGVVNITYS